MMSMQKIKIFNYFYFEIQDIVERPHPISYAFAHNINICIDAMVALRLLYYLIFALNSSTEESMFAYIFSYTDEDTGHLHYDTFFVATFIGLAISSLLLEARLYFSRTDTFTWQMIYDFVVYSEDLYQSCLKDRTERKQIYAQHLAQLRNEALINNKLLTSDWILRMFCTIQARFRSWSNSNFVNKSRLAKTQLRMYPDLPLQLRLRLIMVSKIGNLITTVLLLALYSSFFAFVLFYLITSIVYYFNSFWTALEASCELILFVYMLIRVLEILIFKWNLACGLVYVQKGYCREANRGLLAALRMSRVETGLELPSGLAWALYSFLVNHTNVSHQLIYANRELWSRILFITILNHLPNNAYMLFRIIRGSRSALVWTIFLIQVIYLLAVLLYCATYSRELHVAAGYLPSVQAALAPCKAPLWLKWKCLGCYELLHSRKRLGFTVGPIETVTSKIVFEVASYYVGLLIYLFALLRN